jgi:hypothetical protein
VIDAGRGLSRAAANLRADEVSGASMVTDVHRCNRQNAVWLTPSVPALTSAARSMFGERLSLLLDRPADFPKL